MTQPMLDRIRIASPCTADWNAMKGDDRTRFCGQCRLHVHDLSTLTSAAAEQLLQQAGQGRLCVRFHRRADGKVLVQDCPVGLRQKLRRAWGRAVALVCAVWVSAVACVHSWPLAPAGVVEAPPDSGETLMGDVVPPDAKATAVPAVQNANGAVGPASPVPGPLFLGEVQVVPPPPRNGK